MHCKKVLIFSLYFLLYSQILQAEKNNFPESPDLPLIEQGFLFAQLKQGDNREGTIISLQKAGYLGYRELSSNLIKSPVRWDGHAYELTCKYDEKGGLELCLI